MSFGDDQLKIVFDAFDADKSGEITAKELTNLLNEIWKDSAKAQRGAAYMITLFDRDGDAKISWAEFKEGVKQYLAEEDKGKK